MREHTCSDHAGEPHHRSDGEVDSASHDDQGHADRNHRVDRRLQQDVQDVRWLVEAAGKQREDHEKEGNTGDDTRASNPFKLDALREGGQRLFGAFSIVYLMRTLFILFNLPAGVFHKQIFGEP